MAPNAQAQTTDEAFQKELAKHLKRYASRSAYPHLLPRLYKEVGGTPLFHEGLTLNARARQLIAAVAQLEAHGADRGPYRLGFAADDPQVNKKSLRRLRKRHRKGAKKAVRPFDTGAAKNAKAAARRDVVLTAALVRYLLEFRYLRRSHPTRPTKNVRAFTARHKAKIVAAALPLLADLPARLRALWPKDPDYARLQAELARYRAIVLAAGKQPLMSWPKWKRASRKGAPSGTIVETLQKRLAYEGYYRGPVNGTFDEPTRQALSAFRQSYGLSAGDGVGWTVLTAMNTRLPRRVHQLRLALMRYRESSLQRKGLDTFVRINIPSYTLRLIQKGRLARVHRVIVGNNKLDFNRYDWKQGFLNRTPLLETRVKKVNLNPVWIPPPRILDEDFDGKDRVVVPPGKKNPLGWVKFVLERTNAVFMHDTNRRKLFKKRKRAFSHGCIRIAEALDLAKHVVTTHSKVDEAKYEELRATKKEAPVVLTEELPVYVEYFTVELDSKGRAVFHPDVYGYDKAWLAGKVPTATRRYGSSSLRPKRVPLIGHDDYLRLKKAGGKAPTEWPPPVGPPIETPPIETPPIETPPIETPPAGG